MLSPTHCNGGGFGYHFHELWLVDCALGPHAMAVDRATAGSSRARRCTEAAMVLHAHALRGGTRVSAALARRAGGGCAHPPAPLRPRWAWGGAALLGSPSLTQAPESTMAPPHHLVMILLTLPAGLAYGSRSFSCCMGLADGLYYDENRRRVLLGGGPSAPLTPRFPRSEKRRLRAPWSRLRTGLGELGIAWHVSINIPCSNAWLQAGTRGLDTNGVQRE